MHEKQSLPALGVGTQIAQDVLVKFRLIVIPDPIVKAITQDKQCLGTRRDMLHKMPKQKSALRVRLRQVQV